MVAFFARVQVYVTLDIKRYAKFCRVSEASARLHMQLINYELAPYVQI